MIELPHFCVPESLIPKYPVKPRDHSRLLVVERGQEQMKDEKFYNLIHFLKKGDLMIFNDTRVFAARVFLERRKTKGIHECIFLKRDKLSPNFWEVLIKKSGRFSTGETLRAPHDRQIEFEFHRSGSGEARLREPFFLNPKDFALWGEMPIPPYLKRKAIPNDTDDYQSIFAQRYGSAAAPTASLHFTPELMKEIQKKEVQIGFVTLHIGYGTFSPLNEENLSEKKLHSESYSIPHETAKLMHDQNYSRLVVVGTTALRVLETVFRKTKGKFDHSLTGETDLFLFPPDEIKTADALITNFHLPDSSLILLVECMTRASLLQKIYSHAIGQKYRFFSYGDAMMIV